jgi:hypothetical protein
MRRLGAASRRSLSAVLLAGMMNVAFLSAAGVASAQTDDQRAAARQLATDGAQAFNEGRYQDAVDSFTKAESLVHAPPHLLYLARSYEKLGQLVKAREAYLKVIKENLPANAPQAFHDSQSKAAEEVKAIEPRLAGLAVKVEGGEGGKDLAVLVDGVPIPAVLIGVSRPIDPGEHKIEGGADGFRAEPQTVTLAEGEKKAIVLTMLADPNAKSPAPSAPPPEAAPIIATSAPASNTPPAADQGVNSGEDKSGLRIGSYVAFGVGVLGLGAGTFFTLQSASKRNDADEKFEECGGESGCFNGNPLSKEVSDLDDDASSAQTLGIIGFAVGGVGLAAGTVLFIMSADSKEETASVRPYVGLGSAGLTGKF